ncbi:MULTISPECIES: hypothetical protein [unclassified Streptomyces]|uniref:hypothetical protein n=1 Tax=unclassified Streptomyces TaxID=2593676 RepID=UPI00331F1EED
MGSDPFTFPEPQMVQAAVVTSALKYTARVPVGAMPWDEMTISTRKWLVRKAKAQLLAEGVLCRTCAERYDAAGGPCRLCFPVQMSVWQGMYHPLTDDMLRVYAPTARFHLIATVEGARACYAALELPEPEWTGAGLGGRERFMRQVVDRLREMYRGEATPGRIRTLIADGEREMPYVLNWAAVLDDQAR